MAPQITPSSSTRSLPEIYPIIQNNHKQGSYDMSMSRGGNQTTSCASLGVAYYTAPAKVGELLISEIQEQSPNSYDKRTPISFMLNHYHPSRAQIIKRFSELRTKDDLEIQKFFVEMIEAVDKCCTRLRGATYAGVNDKKGVNIDPWIDNERQADEALLKFLSKTCVQIVLSKKMI